MTVPLPLTKSPRYQIINVHLHRMPGLVRRLFPECLWEMPATNPPTLYLTFDDGPIPDETPFVLEQLARYGARATFFCVGENLERYSDIARQVLAGGHHLGNHTHRHLSGWRTPRPEFLADVARCQQVINGLQPATFPAEARPLLRPPYGRITRPLARALHQTHQLIMWDLLTCDYDPDFAPKACLQASIARTRPGSIVVFHDSRKAAPNLRYVLPRYLDYCAEAGYQFGIL